MKPIKQALLFASISLLAINNTLADSTLHPAVISQQQLAGDISKQANLIIEKHDNGNQTFDVTSMLSSDKKFIVGTYKSSASHFVISEPYGVDEYMHFLEGGVTLTSSDGTVTEIKTGDSVTLSKEWTGIWDTKGYTKIYVIYSPDQVIE